MVLYHHPLSHVCRPIGSGDRFCGVYHRPTQKVVTYERMGKGKVGQEYIGLHELLSHPNLLPPSSSSSLNSARLGLRALKYTELATREDSVRQVKKGRVGAECVAF